MLDRLAPVGFILLWSSTFITARIGLRHISPILFVTVRQTIVALVLLAGMLLLRRSWAPLAGRWHHCAVAGILINGVTLMTAHVGMLSSNAAPMSLMGALNPMLTALLAGPLLGEWLTRRQWLGMVLGLAGVLLVLGLTAMESRAEFHGLLLGVAGIVGLCGGTLYFARYCRGVPLLEGATVQFGAAAAACILSTILFEHARADWTPDAVAALLWNVFAMSIGGMCLYFYMLQRGTAGRAAANFYLVPGTTAVLAWLLLGGTLSLVAIVGFVIASAGVWLVARAKTRP